jgi:regulator of nonsense transcripts 1
LQHPLWHYLLTHYKEKGTLVEGPLSNLQASMIQFSKPRRSLNKSMEPFRRFETNAKDLLGNNNSGPSGTPSRFDSTFYRTHDAMGYIPSDAQSIRSQAPYSSGLPMFGTAGPYAGANGARVGGKRGTYAGYASSIISQDVGGHGSGSVYGGPADTASVIGSSIGGPAPSERASSIAYSQSDRLHRARRGSVSSSWAGTNSELGSVSGYDYKSTDDDADDDVKSQYTAQSQAGVTVY